MRQCEVDGINTRLNVVSVHDQSFQLTLNFSYQFTNATNAIILAVSTPLNVLLFFF